MHTATAQDIGPDWPCCAAVSRMWVNDPAPAITASTVTGSASGDREQAAARTHQPSRRPRRPGRPGRPSPARPCLARLPQCRSGAAPVNAEFLTPGCLPNARPALIHAGGHLPPATRGARPGRAGIDNLSTGCLANLAALDGHPAFEFRRHDITVPCRVRGGLDTIVHLASPAAPGDYLARPLETLRAGKPLERAVGALQDVGEGTTVVQVGGGAGGKCAGAGPDPACHVRGQQVVPLAWGGKRPAGKLAVLQADFLLASAVTDLAVVK